MSATTAGVLVDQPRVANALHTARELAALHTDPQLLAIAERRIAELLRADLLRSELQAIPSESNTAANAIAAPLHAAVLAFVEQWVIDVANITDDMVADLRSELGEDRLMDFIHSVLAIEQRIRLELAWSRLGLAQ